MGFFDNIRGIFKGSKNTGPLPFEEGYTDNELLKTQLSTEIINLVYDLKRVDSLDNDALKYGKVSSSELKNKSVEDS